MTLLATRQHLVELSGRYDLVIDGLNWANNGADFFIQSGQRWLDRIATISKSLSKYYKTLAIGAWYDLIPHCRSIREVWVSNSDGNKWKLTKRDLGDIMYYSDNTGVTLRPALIPVDARESGLLRDPAQLTNSAPINYTPIILRSMPQSIGTVKIDQFGPASYSDATQNYYNLDGIMFLPPVTAGHILEITGQFYQPKLVADTDQNFWTEQEEFTLVLAACRAIEVSMRNQQGVADWESAVMSELRGLEFDEVEEETAEITEIRG